MSLLTIVAGQPTKPLPTYAWVIFLCLAVIALLVLGRVAWWTWRFLTDKEELESGGSYGKQFTEPTHKDES